MPRPTSPGRHGNCSTGQRALQRRRRYSSHWSPSARGRQPSRRSGPQSSLKYFIKIQSLECMKRAIIINNGATPLKDGNDLVGKTVGVQIGTTGNFAVEQFEGVIIKAYDDI